MIKHVNFIIAIILFIVGYTCFQPTKEILSCDSNYNCTLTKELGGVINVSKEFMFDKNTTIEYQRNDLPNILGRNSTAGPVYKLSNGKKVKPFKEPTIDDVKETVADDIISNSADFNAYLKEPFVGYNIQSYADKFDYITWLIYWIAFIFAVVYIAKFTRRKKSEETEGTNETSSEQENSVENENKE